MRRLFFNISIALLTFVIGIAASTLLSLSMPKSVETGQACVKAAVETPVSDRLTIASANDSDEQRAITAESRSAISGGILNDKAINLPQPAYPTVATAARQSGTVIVQVTIDENGSVISARAVGGPPL